MSKTHKFQAYFFAAVILSTIALYSLVNLGTFRPNTLPGWFNVENHILEGKQNLALVLHPTEHTHQPTKTIHQLWNISSDIRAPDGVIKRVYLINGQFPGPLIETRSGDEIVIEVLNGLVDENVAIHWHGLSLRGANDMDGVIGVTQYPIRPGQKFTYKVKIGNEEAGTFWYHAHSELQRADGLYGPLIVHRPVNKEHESLDQHDEDQFLMIGDWYHRSAQEVQDYYTDWKNSGNEPAPDSIVINGKGKFNCSMAVPARPIHCHEVVMPTLQLGSGRTRVRVINTGVLTGFTLSFTGFSATVIRVDGDNIVSNAHKAKSIGILYPGERMDIFLERSNETIPPQLTIKLDRENLKFKNFALTPTQNFPITSISRSKTPPILRVQHPEIQPFFNLFTTLGPTFPSDYLPSNASKTFLLYTKIEILAEFNNIPKGFINRTSWNPSLLNMAPLITLPRGRWNNSFVPWTGPEVNPWIDVVVNNMDDKGHPFHLHGNPFHVLYTHKNSAGEYGFYNPFESRSLLNLNTLNPITKDTIYIPGRGYVILRFRADNEGIWLFHCHLLWHHAVGMGMGFHIGGTAEGLFSARRVNNE